MAVLLKNEEYGASTQENPVVFGYILYGGGSSVLKYVTGFMSDSDGAFFAAGAGGVDAFGAFAGAVEAGAGGGDEGGGGGVFCAVVAGFLYPNNSV